MIRTSSFALSMSIAASGCMTAASPDPSGDPASPDPTTTSPSPRAWTNTPVPFVAALDDVQVSYTLVQPTATDGAIGLSNGATRGIEDLGPVVHLDPSGALQVADGAGFRADKVVAYTAGPVAIVMHIDLVTHRYSVEANGEALATSYAFHASQAQLSRIDTLASHADGAALAITDVAVGPEFCSYAASAWVDLYHPPQPGSYQVRFDAKVPASGNGALVGLAARDVTNASDLAASVRFANGALVARDGATYRADHAVSYAPDVTYTFTFAVDVAGGTYSVAVGPRGASTTPTQLASGYAFDPAQGATAPMSQVGASATAGYVKVCNLAVWSY